MSKFWFLEVKCVDIVRKNCGFSGEIVSVLRSEIIALTITLAIQLSVDWGSMKSYNAGRLGV